MHSKHTDDGSTNANWIFFKTVKPKEKEREREREIAKDILSFFLLKKKHIYLLDCQDIREMMYSKILRHT